MSHSQILDSHICKSFSTSFDELKEVQKWGCKEMRGIPPKCLFRRGVQSKGAVVKVLASEADCPFNPQRPSHDTLALGQKFGAVMLYDQSLLLLNVQPQPVQTRILPPFCFRPSQRTIVHLSMNSVKPPTIRHLGST